LVVRKFVTLLLLKDLLEFLALELIFGIHLGEVFLELLLDVLDGIIHFLLLLGLIVYELLFDLVELVGKLLALLAAGVQSTGQELVLACLILLHHVFHVLHLVLKLVDHVINFSAISSLLFEDVAHSSALVVCTINLLLQYCVLLTVQV